MIDIDTMLTSTLLDQDLVKPLVSDLLGNQAQNTIMLSELKVPDLSLESLSIEDQAIIQLSQPQAATRSMPNQSRLDPFTGQEEQSQDSSQQPTDGLTGTSLAKLTASTEGFIQREGQGLIDGEGNPFTFKGIAFGNQVWDNDKIPSNFHHRAIDFKRVKDMGFNSVRFYLNYRWFEDNRTPFQYKESGWTWLDKNISWAKQNDISLVLNMHVPQGGFQSQGQGDALWNRPKNQERLTALWKTIANRYKNETTIAGYGLVNEPIVVGSKQRWQTLAQNIANNIRQVNQNHLLFVEQVLGVKKSNTIDYSGTPDQKFIKINDPNTIYEFHFYDPYEFTHQRFDWAFQGDGGKYPDYDRIENKSDLKWYTGTFNNPRLEVGDTNWQYFKGEKYEVTNAKIKATLPALVAENIGVNGQVSFDDVVIKEFNPSGELTRTFNFDTNRLDDWGFWSLNGTGKAGTSTAGHNDAAALTITGTTADSNISNYNQPIITKQGYSYQVSGWMKGDNVTADANAQIRLDLYTSTKPLQVRDKKFLNQLLQPYINWGKKNGVPLYLGEFGAGRPTFENNKGGLAWVNDVLDIALKNNLSFNYHTYHEDSFGLNPGYGELIDPSLVNKPLKNLFMAKLA